MGLNEMPPQPWEPGQARDWREALDSWFSVSRWMAATVFSYRQHQMLQLMATAESRLHLHAGGAVDGELDDPDRARLAWERLGGQHLSSIDTMLLRALTTYTQHRDRTTTAYLGGLRAGGLPARDWRPWLLQRARSWVDGERAARLLEQEIAVADHPFDRLPDYWTRR